MTICLEADPDLTFLARDDLVSFESEKDAHKHPDVVDYHSETIDVRSLDNMELALHKGEGLLLTLHGHHDDLGDCDDSHV